MTMSSKKSSQIDEAKLRTMEKTRAVEALRLHFVSELCLCFATLA
jgi:hypothetical protein